MKYKSLRTFIRFVMNLIADVEIVGMDKFLDSTDKLPEGNAMLAANHLGNLDTAVLLYAYDRDDFILAIAEKYKYHPIIGPLGRYVDAVWLNRFEADFSALREILARTEAYFCPIKHAHKILGTHARYNRFLDYGDAADYEARLEEFRVALGKAK